MTYNLLEEPWIPVLWNNGQTSRVGIKEAFTQAGRIRQIAASNPMDRVAILRFLLALLYWCKGNPPDANAAPGDSFPATWFSKLDDQRECFNLLGEGKRFYQDHTARRPRPSTDLIQEIPTGNNFWHFKHSTDRVDGLCPACCAFGLLRLPMFSVSGLPNLKAGINGIPPVYVVPWRGTLYETLLTNWISARSLGVPAWVQTDVRSTAGQDVPLLTGLTTLSRRVWLHDAEGPPGVCIGCGAKEATLVRTCEFQTAGDQKNDRWTDPHVIYSDETPRRSSRATDLTAAGKFRMDRPWPDLLARMVETGKLAFTHVPQSFLIVGFATDQAKNIDVWERTIRLSPGAPVQPTSVPLIRQWQKEGTRLAWSLTRAAEPPQEKRSSRKNVEVPAALAAVRPHIEGKVSAKSDELLAGGDAAWEEAAREYRPMMECIARSLAPGFATAAVQRRRQIAGVLPDMSPKPTKDQQAAKRKRGRK